MDKSKGVAGGVLGGVLGGVTGVGGVIKDPSGAVIPGARVIVRNVESGEVQTATTDSNGNYNVANLRPGNFTLTAAIPGFQTYTVNNLWVRAGRVNNISPTLSVGSVSQTVAVSAQSPELSIEAVERQGPEAEAKAIGDFFEYNLKERVTIGKNQSALVPILQARIEAEKVTLLNQDNGQPLRALWITNTSGIEFDAGSFNILDQGTFAGEGMVDTVRRVRSA